MFRDLFPYLNAWKDFRQGVVLKTTYDDTLSPDGVFWTETSAYVPALTVALVADGAVFSLEELATWISLDIVLISDLQDKNDLKCLGSTGDSAT